MDRAYFWLARYLCSAPQHSIAPTWLLEETPTLGSPTAVWIRSNHLAMTTAFSSIYHRREVQETVLVAQ